MSVIRVSVHFVYEWQFIWNKVFATEFWSCLSLVMLLLVYAGTVRNKCNFISQRHSKYALEEQFLICALSVYMMLCCLCLQTQYSYLVDSSIDTINTINFWKLWNRLMYRDMQLDRTIFWSSNKCMFANTRLLQWNQPTTWKC